MQGIHHTTHLQAPSAEAVDQHTLPIVWGWTVFKEKRDVKKVNTIRSLIKSQACSVKNTLVDVKLSEQKRMRLNRAIYTRKNKTRLK